MKKRIVSVLLVLTMVIGTAQVAGASKLSDAKSGLNSANQKINEIQNQQSSLQSQIDALDSELVQLMVDINVNKDEITKKEAELQKAQADLAAAQQQEQEKYDDMKSHIKYTYENGNGSLLTALLSSSSISDVINKVSYYNDMYDYEKKMLTQYQEAKEIFANEIQKCILEDNYTPEQAVSSMEERVAKLFK